MDRVDLEDLANLERPACRQLQGHRVDQLHLELQLNPTINLINKHLNDRHIHFAVLDFQDNLLDRWVLVNLILRCCLFHQFFLAILDYRLFRLVQEVLRALLVLVNQDFQDYPRRRNNEY